jgi:hypothetical protein
MAINAVLAIVVIYTENPFDGGQFQPLTGGGVCSSIKTMALEGETLKRLRHGEDVCVPVFSYRFRRGISTTQTTK